MKRLQPYLPMLVIFCLALLVRIIYNITVGKGYIPNYDSATYEKIALHMLNEHCFCLNPRLPRLGVRRSGRALLLVSTLCWATKIALCVSFYASLVPVRVCLSRYSAEIFLGGA